MTADPHTLTLEPQPIADQWMGKCSCGWRTTVSIYEQPTREAMVEEILRQHGEHRGQGYPVGGIVNLGQTAPAPLPEGAVGRTPGGRLIYDGDWFDKKMAELGPSITIQIGQKR